MEREKAITDIRFVPMPTRSDFVSYIGRRYGRLTVIGHGGMRKTNRLWWCRCDCGGMTKVQSADLRANKVVSCGCYRSDCTSDKNLRHGKSKTPEYAIWCAIKARCLNPDDPAYPNYGGRGIYICAEWRESFETFYRDMGARPSRSSTVERIDNNKPYSHENCEWRSRQRQNNNKRNNRLLTARGQTHTMADWARLVTTPYSTIRSRKRLGYSDEQAIFDI